MLQGIPKKPVSGKAYSILMFLFQISIDDLLLQELIFEASIDLMIKELAIKVHRGIDCENDEDKRTAVPLYT